MQVTRSSTGDNSKPTQASILAPRQKELVSYLERRVSGINRGSIASSKVRQEVEEVITSLEALAPEYDSDLLSGGWELIYASVEPFRSSPFFW